MESIKTRTIRWGIVGLGKIAEKFATDLLTVKDAELYAVASRDQEKANKFASKYNAQKAFGRYQDLSNDERVDAVYIATPHVFHKENSMMFLKKGIAVLCEKPLGINHEEVTEMIDCAQANNVLLMEALWTYFLPHYQYVLTLLKENHFGKIVKLEADFGFNPDYDESSRLMNKSLGGGSLLDIGIYPIFAALSTLGLPKKMDATATYFNTDVDSSCAMVFHYPNQVTAHLKSTLIEKTPTQAIFYCEKGTIRINTMFHQPSTVTLISEGTEKTIDFDYNTIGYNFETEHFNQLLKQGKTQSNIMTFSFSKKLVKLLDQVRNTIELAY